MKFEIFRNQFVFERPGKSSQTFDLQEINPYVDGWEEAGAYPAHKVSTFPSLSRVEGLDPEKGQCFVPGTIS